MKVTRGKTPATLFSRSSCRRRRERGHRAGETAPPEPRRSRTAAYPDVHDLCDLPEVNEEPDEDADLHHEVGFVVQDVEEDDEGLEDAEKDGADREPLQRLPAVPELDVCGEGTQAVTSMEGKGNPPAPEAAESDRGTSLGGGSERIMGCNRQSRGISAGGGDPENHKFPAFCPQLSPAAWRSAAEERRPPQRAPQRPQPAPGRGWI